MSCPGGCSENDSKPSVLRGTAPSFLNTSRGNEKKSVSRSLTQPKMPEMGKNVNKKNSFKK